MNLLDTLSISASGLTAQRVRLQSVASNMANARTTRTADGGPYVRQLPVLVAEEGGFGSEFERSLSRVRVVGIQDSDDPPVMVYDPGHPDAGDDGYVAMPNVNILQEMVDLMTTSRTYEANATVVDVTKQLAQLALEIGR
jgi:flagellar basal-body rod protein FlgC